MMDPLTKKPKSSARVWSFDEDGQGKMMPNQRCHRWVKRTEPNHGTVQGEGGNGVCSSDTKGSSGSSNGVSEFVFLSGCHATLAISQPASLHWGLGGRAGSVRCCACAAGALGSGAEIARQGQGQVWRRKSGPKIWCTRDPRLTARFCSFIDPWFSLSSMYCARGPILTVASVPPLLALHGFFRLSRAGGSVACSRAGACHAIVLPWPCAAPLLAAPSSGLVCLGHGLTDRRSLSMLSLL
jgi:hypothetical protein